MTLPPSHHGRASDGTAPGIASHEETRPDLTVHEAGEVVWLAVQLDLRRKAVREARAEVAEKEAAAERTPDLIPPRPSDPSVADGLPEEEQGTAGEGRSEEPSLSPEGGENP